MSFRAVRVVVNTIAESAEMADAAIAARLEACKHTEVSEEGCLQYELFRSQQHPERFCLLELWSSKETYDKHWRLQQEREKASPPVPPPGKRTVTIEFYQQDVYQRLDGIWQSVNAAERTETVRWT